MRAATLAVFVCTLAALATASSPICRLEAVGGCAPLAGDGLHDKVLKCLQNEVCSKPIFVDYPELKALLPRITQYHPGCTHIMPAFRADGIGAITQQRLTVMAYAKMMGIMYIHPPLHDILYHPYNTTLYNEFYLFFNMGQGEMSLAQAVASDEPGFKQICLMGGCFATMDGQTGCWVHIQDEIRSRYWASPLPKPTVVLPPTAAEVAAGGTATITLATSGSKLTSFVGATAGMQRILMVLHVRRGDVVARQGEHFRMSNMSYYPSVITALKRVIPDNLKKNGMDIVVVSEGPPSDFAMITNAHSETRLFLGRSVLETLHLMISADVLVTAKSSFSYTAALFSHGLVVYHEYWSRPLPQWVVTNEHMNAEDMVKAMSGNPYIASWSKSMEQRQQQQQQQQG